MPEHDARFCMDQGPMTAEFYYHQCYMALVKDRGEKYVLSPEGQAMLRTLIEVSHADMRTMWWGQKMGQMIQSFQTLQENLAACRFGPED